MGPHNTGQRLRQVLDLYNVSKAATYILGPFLITDDGQQPVIIGPAPGHFYSEPNTPQTRHTTKSTTSLKAPALTPRLTPLLPQPTEFTGLKAENVRSLLVIVDLVSAILKVIRVQAVLDLSNKLNRE